MEPKPKERIVFDEDLYYGDECEEMAINDLMERDGLTEGEVREDFTDFQDWCDENNDCWSLALDSGLSPVIEKYIDGRFY